MLKGFIVIGIIAFGITIVIGSIFKNFTVGLIVAAICVVAFFLFLFISNRYKQNKAIETKINKNFNASSSWYLNDSTVEFDDIKKEMCITHNTEHIVSFIQYSDIISYEDLGSEEVLTEKGWSGAIAGSLIGGPGMATLGGLATEKHHDAVKIFLYIKTKNQTYCAPIFIKPVIVNEQIKPIIVNALHVMEKLDSIIRSNQAKQA